VTLSPFLIAKYEVTEAQWTRIMGKNPSHLKGEDHPVESVTWFDCQAFSAASGLALPSEAQWEYACRAGTSERYGGTGKLEDMGWSASKDAPAHQPVGRKKANGFGLHDMHGNVSEWVEDIKDKVFYSRPEAAGPDPVCKMRPADQLLPGEVDGGEAPCVARGGGTHHALFCRSAVRTAYYPSDGSADLGLRPVFNLRQDAPHAASVTDRRRPRLHFPRHPCSVHSAGSNPGAGAHSGKGSAGGGPPRNRWLRR